MTKEIYQWAIIQDQDPFKAPELRSMYINGLLESDESDHWISTSRIVGKRGEDCVVTKSGLLS